jgi:flavin reductase (DIM6/NTAB) family NADH-FMN oxidoreductase RutF/DNA-binding MarR family transcriptional regulator
MTRETAGSRPPISTCFDGQAYRRALGNFATGVTVVTARKPGDGGYLGITANSFNSVSLDPPLVLWSLDRKALSLPFFEQADYFVVNVLARDQVALSKRFAGRGRGDKFEGVSYREGRGGAPILSGCAASFQCRRQLAYDGGDHVIFLGEVHEFTDHGRPGLIYHCGGYAVSERHPVMDSGSGTGFTENDIGHLLARALVCFQAQFDPVLDRAGINRAEWQVLCALSDRHAGLSLEETATASLLPTASAGQALERLAAGDLIGLAQQDGGVDIWKLTVRGQAFLDPLLVAAAAYESDTLGQLSAADARQLKELLKALPRPVQASRQSSAFLIDGRSKQ